MDPASPAAPLLHYASEQSSLDGTSRVQNIVQNAWFAFGLIQPPRLRKDWNKLSKGDDHHIRSLNTFFDTMFAIAVTHIGVELRKKQNAEALANWALNFGMIVSLWLNTAEYSSRFDNDDLVHKVFWGLYGIGTLGILMHVTGGCHHPNAFYEACCFSYVYGLMALHYCRIAIALPRCTILTSAQAVMMALLSSLAVLAAFYPEHRALLFWIVAMGYPLTVATQIIVTLCYSYWVYGDNSAETRHRVDLPLNIEFHINRFHGFMMMVLGQLALAVAIHPEEGFTNHSGLYAAVIVAFFMLVGMKLFLFDVDYIDVGDHAIRRSVGTALLWLVSYPAGVGCVALVGSGIALLVRCMGGGSGANDEFAQWLTCTAMSTFLLISCVSRCLHYVPYTRMLTETHHEDQAKTLYVVHYAQIAIQCVAAIVVYSLQFWNVSSFQTLVVLVGIMTFLVVVNLIDELVLLNDPHVHDACVDADQKMSRSKPKHHQHT